MRISVKLLAAIAAVSGIQFAAHAGELDNEKAITNQQAQLAADLPQTVVIRTNTKTKEVELVQLNEKISPTEESKSAVAKLVFAKADLKAQVPGGAKPR